MSAKSMEDIASAIQAMSFNKKTLFGVDELDVLKKFELLHQEYESLFNYQEAYYKALLDEKEAKIQELLNEKEG